MVEFIVEKEREKDREGILSTASTAHHTEYIALFCHCKLSMKFHFVLSVFPVNIDHPKHTYSNKLMNSH